MVNSMSQTGKIIQEMRIKAGFTQKSLADAIHITDKAISKWERGICLPDTALLPKIALILGVDINHLMSVSIEEEDWVGLIDIHDCDLSQKIYDKPLVYYLLNHYLLLGITDIHFITDEVNQEYLKKPWYEQFGFSFSFDVPTDKNVMLIRHPWFLFGSDLTQLFQGTMLSGRTVSLKPENQESIFYFIQKDESEILNDPEGLDEKCVPRTLGRGMIAFDMGDYDKCLDVAAFVRTYQANTGMLMASLEEIAYRQGRLSEEKIKEIADIVPCGGYLAKLIHPNIDDAKRN